jgi:hypothetical protein
MSKRDFGYVLVSACGRYWWAGNGTLPVGTVRQTGLCQQRRGNHSGAA